MAKRTPTTEPTPTSEATERAKRRSSREMLVAQLRKLPFEDLCDVFYDFGGIATRAAPIAIESVREGLAAAKNGDFKPRISAVDDPATPELPFQSEGSSS